MLHATRLFAAFQHISYNAKNSTLTKFESDPGFYSFKFQYKSESYTATKVV